MSVPETRFDHGAAYEQLMGNWSRAVGEIFLDWLAPAPGLAWADIGCGSGAFTGAICRRCAPSRLDGIDPSEALLAFARSRPEAAGAHFLQGDAQALPYQDGAFDIAAMALVIFFVPDPAKAVAEMRRVTRKGGLVAAYAWDVPGGGVPFQPFWSTLRALGRTPVIPPRAEVSSTEGLRALWHDAGLAQLMQREIAVTRSFPGFDAYWRANMHSANLREAAATMAPAELARLQDGVRSHLRETPDGSVAFTARANAITGRVP